MKLKTLVRLLDLKLIGLFAGHITCTVRHNSSSLSQSLHLSGVLYGVCPVSIAQCESPPSFKEGKSIFVQSVLPLPIS